MTIEFGSTCPPFCWRGPTKVGLCHRSARSRARSDGSRTWRSTSLPYRSSTSNLVPQCPLVAAKTSISFWGRNSQIVFPSSTIASLNNSPENQCWNCRGPTVLFHLSRTSSLKGRESPVIWYLHKLLPMLVRTPASQYLDHEEEEEGTNNMQHDTTFFLRNACMHEKKCYCDGFWDQDSQSLLMVYNNYSQLHMNLDTISIESTSQVTF